MPPKPTGVGPSIAIPWIVRLRYAMAAGQVLTAVLADRLLGIDLPLRWIWIAPALVALSNFLLKSKGAARHLSGLVWFFVLDAVCLTAVLMLTGGPNNPFSLLYLVHITLSATILTQRQTWGLGVISTICFGMLFWWYRPIAALEMHHHGEGVNLHLTGMWVGFAVACLLVAMFSARISELLRGMQEELARQERLASLVTLAAGAAHELNTPLGTIAVVARELELCSDRQPPDAIAHAIAEDSRLIRTEVERCRKILQRMSTHGAEPAGEALERIPAADLLNRAASAFPEKRLVTRPGAPSPLVSVPAHAFEQALVALIKNALDASPEGKPVELNIVQRGDSVHFVITDSGSGMAAGTLRHVGEPFFTTKDPGKGMGLGLFLVRTLAEQLGGRLILESELGQGTTASLQLPVAESRAEVETSK